MNMNKEGRWILCSEGDETELIKRMWKKQRKYTNAGHIESSYYENEYSSTSCSNTLACVRAAYLKRYFSFRITDYE